MGQFRVAKSNYALYYPTIEFCDYQWLWRAALVWDRIYRIVPSDYEPQDCDNVRALVEAGEIGVPIRPNVYAAQVATDLIDKIESREWSAAALDRDIPQEYARLHADKVDVQLRQLIIAKGGGDAGSEWMCVPTEFEAHYMTCLANRVADANHLQLLSDKMAAWTGSTYFRFNGEIEDFPSDQLSQQLATLIIRDFLPANVLDITPAQLLKFREKHKIQRIRLLSSIRNSAESMANCEDATVIQDHISDLRRDIESSLKDYRESLRTLDVVELTGIKSISFPIITEAVSRICGHGLSPETLSIVSAAGIAIGLVSGLADWREKRKLLKESDYSYLLHLGREWRGNAMYGNDYNYMLCRSMEEFIND